MAVTVRTIKRKPLTLKKPGAEGEVPAVDTETPGSDTDQQTTDQQPSTSAGSPATAASVAAPVQTKEPSYVFAGICGIFVFIMFVTIVILQYLEWDYYIQPKCAFPNTMHVTSHSSYDAPTAALPDDIPVIE